MGAASVAYLVYNVGTFLSPAAPGISNSSPHRSGGAGMRMGPNTDRVPASVNRYLLPHERQVVSVHQHPAVLIGRIFVVLVAFVAAVWLSISVASDNGTALLIIWFLWGLLLVWLAVKVVDCP